MSASITEQILARILVVLTGTTAAGPRVERGREDAFAEDEIPAINILRGDTETIPAALNADQVKLFFTLELYAASETAADQLHAEAHQLLASDATLGPLTDHTLINTGTESTGASASYTPHRLTAHYEIAAWVSRHDITQPA